MSREPPEIASGACRSARCPSVRERVTLPTAPPGNATPPPPAPSRGLGRAGNPELLGWGCRGGGDVGTQTCASGVWSWREQPGENSLARLWGFGPEGVVATLRPVPYPHQRPDSPPDSRLYIFFKCFLPTLSLRPRQSLSFLPRASPLEGCSVWAPLWSSRFVFSIICISQMQVCTSSHDILALCLSSLGSQGI